MYSESKYITREDYLKRGDILLYENHHTAVVLTNGPKVEPDKHYDGKGIGMAYSYGTMNVRKGPGTNYNAVGVINPGTGVEVLEITSNNWYKIVWDSVSEGYAYVSNEGNKFFRFEEKPAPNYRGTATANNSMHVRKENKASAKSLGVISAGTKFDVIDIMPNKWYKVEYKDQIGYISNANGKYFSFTENLNYKWSDPVAKARAYSSMNIRDFASVSGSSILGTISGGTVLDVLERVNNGWLRVKYAKAPGGWAYVSNSGNKYFDVTDNKS